MLLMVSLGKPPIIGHPTLGVKEMLPVAVLINEKKESGALGNART